MFKGLIYKIELGDDVYVGSTKALKLCYRQSVHNWNLRNGRTAKLYKTARELGIEKLKCIWLEDYECNKLCKLRAREEELRKELNAQLNDRNCCGADIERQKNTARQYYKIYMPKYVRSNKERIKVIRARYYQKNKEHIKKRSKDYYHKNKEAIKKRRSYKRKGLIAT
ncbi:MAG TPA: hypothetical protein ENG48_12315 [Candidatus Atribacteria bacterium]|nr:hypothetical protein [Candidatus Atribacteria bacterium]